MSCGYRSVASAVPLDLSLLTCAFRFGITLLVFFYSSSALTKWKGEIKKKLEGSALAALLAY